MRQTRRTKLTTQKIVELFTQVHGETYDYSQVSYEKMDKDVSIICPRHGVFTQRPNVHLNRRSGCQKCAHEKQKAGQRGTTESFIEKAIAIHGTRYDYSKTVYGKSAHDKVVVICREHGEFLTIPNGHISQKTGCPVCGKRATGWTRASWREACRNKVAKLYIIRCYSDTESFYKIGITNKSSISRRFCNRTVMPYQYEVIRIIKSKDDPDYIYNLERTLHKAHSRFKYKPIIRFEGDSECFSSLLLSDTVISIDNIEQE